MANIPNCVCDSKNCIYTNNGIVINYDIKEKFLIEIGIPNRRLGFLFPNRTYQAKDVIVHPKYDLHAKASPNDLVIIELNKKVQYIDNIIGPICLPGVQGDKFEIAQIAQIIHEYIGCTFL